MKKKKILIATFLVHYLRSYVKKSRTMVGVLCQVIRPRVEENVKCAKIFEEKERERKKETESERGKGGKKEKKKYLGNTLNGTFVYLSLY